MCQKEVMEILHKNQKKFYSSLRLSKLLGVNQQTIARSMTILIKHRMVEQKFIYKDSIKRCIRLIKYR